MSTDASCLGCLDQGFHRGPVSALSLPPQWQMTPCKQLEAWERLGGLTVYSELEVLGLLAGWAEGHTLVVALITQVAVGDPEDLAVLLGLDTRVSGEDRPREVVKAKLLVGPGAGQASCADWGSQLGTS